ncbi:MAG TPA: integrase arm-type DNA-binding domain-containing protein [Bordetella sp.]
MPLTDTACRQAKPQEKPYKLSDGGGLYLLVNQKGKYWRWDYRFEAKRKTMALGVYPDVPLAAARQAHKEARQVLAGGTDPMGERKAKKEDFTFEAIARQWYAHWSPSISVDHADYVLRRLEADVFPEIGSKRINDLSAVNFRDVAKKIENRGALDIAKRSLQTCGQIMRYAVTHGLAERNPVSDIRPSDVIKTQKKRNYSRIDAKELPNLLREIDNYSYYSKLAGAAAGATAGIKIGEIIDTKILAASRCLECGYAFHPG